MNVYAHLSLPCSFPLSILCIRLTKFVTKETIPSICHWLIQQSEPPRKRPLLPSEPVRSVCCSPTFPLTSCTLALPGTAGGGRGAAERRGSSSTRLWRRVTLLYMHGTKRRDFTDEVTCSDVDPSRSSASETTVLQKVFNCFSIPSLLD